MQTPRKTRCRLQVPIGGVLGLVNAIWDGGDGSQFFPRSRGEERCSRPTEARNDAERGKTGSVPSASTPSRKKRAPGTSGCGENLLILRCRPRLGMAKAFVLRLA